MVKDAESEVILCVPYTDLFYALLTAQNTNIKELPLRTKPLNYTPPASYIDMLRQP